MAIDGASDIIAENVSENSYVRNAVRRLFAAEAIITSKLVKGKDAEGQKYKDYFRLLIALEKDTFAYVARYPTCRGREMS